MFFMFSEFLIDWPEVGTKRDNNIAKNTNIRRFLVALQTKIVSFREKRSRSIKNFLTETSFDKIKNIPRLLLYSNNNYDNLCPI